MAEREYERNEKEVDVERSSEDIRRNIAQEKENISRNVDQIGERIKEKLDWREYVKDSPFWAIGVAAGCGYLASKIIIPRTTPMERLRDSIAGQVRGSLGGLDAGPGLIKLIVLGIVTKAADRWIKKISPVKDAEGGDSGPQPSNGGDSSLRQE